MRMKMGRVATVSILALAVAWAMPALSDVVVENDAFKLVVGDDARAKSLVVKATGEETLDNGEELPISRSRKNEFRSRMLAIKGFR